MGKQVILPMPRIEQNPERMYVHFVLEADPTNAFNAAFMRFLENNRIKLEQWGVVVYQGAVTPRQIDITGLHVAQETLEEPVPFIQLRGTGLGGDQGS